MFEEARALWTEGLKAPENEKTPEAKTGEAKFSIKKHMTESERYDILKDKSIKLSHINVDALNGVSIDGYNMITAREAKKRLKNLPIYLEYTMSITQTATLIWSLASQKKFEYKH